MIKVVAFEQLEDMTSQLFVETLCPNCGRILISLVTDARNILVFGCTLCANIESSTLFPISDSPASIILTSESSESSASESPTEETE